MSPADTSAYEIKRRQQVQALVALPTAANLMRKSSDLRWWRMNHDMAVRIDAARSTDSEEDVEVAVVRSRGLPAEPPANWKDPLHRG